MAESIMTYLVQQWYNMLLKVQTFVMKRQKWNSNDTSNVIMLLKQREV